jgi:uncharacterized protein (TIGR03435 family)
MALIQAAYNPSPNVLLNLAPPIPVEGGPEWLNSDRYNLDAKVESNSGPEVAQAAMVQSVLVDRFKLKVHRETREIPVYTLTVARGGAKFQPWDDGSCVRLDPAKPPTPGAPGAPGQTPFCSTRIGLRGSNVTFDSQASTLEEFSQRLGRILDRPVVDKTGSKGMFDFHLEFTPDGTTPNLVGAAPAPAIDASPQAAGGRGGGRGRGGRGPAPSSTPSNDVPGTTILTAIQEQLGLRLEPGQGSREVLVVDRVEKPSEN